jgi:excisionase family DNA binding protein
MGKIRKMRKEKPSTESYGFATAGEAATFLRLSRAMIHKLIAQGKIPASRYGRSVRISWTWLRAQAEA